MSQFKVYGQRQVLTPLRTELSEVLHAAAVEVLGLPPDLEMTLVETPRHDWAIRGQAGDDLTLTYVVE